MKIAVLVRMFPNIVQTYVLNHILSIRNHGDDAYIIAESDPKQREVHPSVIDQGLLDMTTYIDVTRSKLLHELGAIPWLKPRFYLLLPRLAKCLFRPGMGIFYLVKSVFRLRLLVHKQIDIIHSHSLFCSHDYLFLKTCYNMPMVTTFHGHVPNDVKMLARNNVKAVLEAGDVFLVNTQFARQQLLDMGCDDVRIKIIPQGTNLDEHPYRQRHIRQDEPIIILSVGRLSIEKGFHIAIDAIARLADEIPTVQYRIVGHGVERQALQQKIDELGLQDKVHLLGGISSKELQAQYSQAHMFILPSITMEDGSHTETQGVVLQEAQSSGIPVIASRTGGIPEVIQHDETGLLFDEGDSGTLTQHVRRLVQDPQEYARLIAAGRQDVEQNYSAQAIYQRQRELYEHILETSQEI